MIKAQVLETLKWKCKRKVREERTPRDFILVHSNLSYIQFVKATLAWLCTISKVLQSIHPYTSKICKNTTKDSWITWITPAQQEPSCRPGKPPGIHTKLEKDQTLVVAQPFLPQTTFSKLQTKPKTPRIDPRSIFNSCNTYDHEGESFHKFPKPNRALKWSTDLSFENHSFYSQTITKFNRLIFKSIGWFHLTSLDLSEINRLKTKSIDWICCKFRLLQPTF